MAGRPDTPPARAGDGSSVLSIVAIILSSVALLAPAGVFVLVGFFALLPGIGTEDGSWTSGGWTTTGQLDSTPTGALTGPVLVEELTATLEDDGSTVEDLNCPDTTNVAQGVVTVCHGVVDGEPWALAVFFESTAGAYTVDFI